MRRFPKNTLSLLVLFHSFFYTSPLFILQILFEDTLRKRAWPKLVGLDYKLDPIIFQSSNDVGGEERKGDNSKSNNKTHPRRPTSKPIVPHLDSSVDEPKNSLQLTQVHRRILLALRGLPVLHVRRHKLHCHYFQ